MSYDYRLAPKSRAIKAGVEPGRAGSFDLLPEFQCRHLLSKEARPKSEKPDVGAFGYAAGK